MDLAQALEAARIAQSPGVIASSLVLRRADGAEIFSFDIATEPMVEAPAADVRDVVKFLDFLLQYLYNLPNEIAEYRKRRVDKTDGAA